MAPAQANSLPAHKTYSREQPALLSGGPPNAFWEIEVEEDEALRGTCIRWKSKLKPLEKLTGPLTPQLCSQCSWKCVGQRRSRLLSLSDHTDSRSWSPGPLSKETLFSLCPPPSIHPTCYSSVSASCGEITANLLSISRELRGPPECRRRIMEKRSCGHVLREVLGCLMGFRGCFREGLEGFLEHVERLPGVLIIPVFPLKVSSPWPSCVSVCKKHSWRGAPDTCPGWPGPPTTPDRRRMCWQGAVICGPLICKVSLTLSLSLLRQTVILRAHKYCADS